ncbi:hypothetical protein ACFY3B_19415 [Micromonospora parva]|uniref:Uncharacterized protein n=1 Tax=Micromonospora parva TaxID=1464048 RepID=A0ABW6VWX3_9ACTN
MRGMVDRLVARTVLVCAALAVVAFAYNHTTQPCASNEAGAGGMCVSTSWAAR